MKVIFSLIFTLFLYFNCEATNYYWVNGSGNWSDYGTHWANTSGGSVFHVQPPTPADDVFFDANSFPVTGDTLIFDTTLINCKTLDFSGITNSPILLSNGTANIDIYGSFIIHGNVNWKLHVNLNFKSAFSGNIINTAGTLFSYTYYPTIALNGSGDFSLQSDLILDSTLNSYSGGSLLIQNGNFHSNGHHLCVSNINIQTNDSAFFSNSFIECENWGATGNFDADSTMIDVNSTFYGTQSGVYNDVRAKVINQCDSCLFHDIVADSITHLNNSTVNNATVLTGISGSNTALNKVLINGVRSSLISSGQPLTFDTLIYSIAGSINQAEGVINVNNYLQADGTCARFTEIKGNATINNNGNNVTLNYAILRDITITGTTISANNSIDNGNVNGVIFNAPSNTDLYWVGGTGQWSDPNHWSTTSGGPGGTCPPSPANNVFFDANSFQIGSDTLFLDSVIYYCKTLDFSGLTNNITLRRSVYGPSNIDVYGSFIIHGNVTWRMISNLNFRSSSAGNIINTAGTWFGAYCAPTLILNGIGNWSLQNDLILDSVLYANPGGSLIVQSGTFYSNGNNLKVEEINVLTTGNTVFSTSDISCGKWNSLGSIDADSTVIHAGLFTGDRQTYNDVFAIQNIQCDSCSFHNVTSATGISGKNSTFSKIILNGAGSWINCSPQSLTTDTLIYSQVGSINGLSGTINVNNYLQIDGTCSQYAELKGIATIHKNGGNVSLNYVLLQDISATGATFTANNSIDNGNVNGVTFNTPPGADLYWVGGTGYWDDPTHWSTTSGGTGGNCVPSPANNVFFDANSFPSAGDTLYVFSPRHYCKTLDFSGLINVVTVYSFNATPTIDIYGSLIIHGNLNWQLSGAIFNFKSASTGNIINTAGTSWNPLIYIDGTGDWSLQSDLEMDTIHNYGIGALVIKNGTLYSNGYSIKADMIDIQTIGHAMFSTSNIECTDWKAAGYVVADSTIINVRNLFIGSYQHPQIYNDVFAKNIYLCDSARFHDIVADRISVLYNSSVNNATVLYEISGSNSSFNKVVINGASASLACSTQTFTIDTLIINNPGAQLALSGNIVINDSLTVLSSSAFPTKLSGPATINYNHTFCDDFIYLQDITGVGGPLFAGDHSVDLGGNSGWIFASCSPAFSNVWTGDANYDLVVDNIDLLYMGVAFGDTGYVRPSASMAFTAQPCRDWYFQFINGTNIKKADSDGNGTIDFPDTTAVSMNYGLVHPFRLAHRNNSSNSGTELFLQLPVGTAVPGTVMSVPIIFGTPANIADIYGLAFTINYDQSMIQPGSLSIDFTNSWIEPGNNYLSLVKDFSSTGECDAAFTRIDHNDTSGNGIIGFLNFTVSNSASGYLHFSFSGIKAMLHNETEVPVMTNVDSVYTNINDFTSERFVIYPNPASGNSTVWLGNDIGERFEIEILDATGKQILFATTGENHFLIDRDVLTAGIYLLKIKDQKGNRYTQKLIRQ